MHIYIYIHLYIASTPTCSNASASCSGSHNLLKKCNLLYIRKQSVPRCKHFMPRLKTNQLMTYKAKAAVCSEICIKHSTKSEHHVGFFNVKPGGT